MGPWNSPGFSPDISSSSALFSDEFTEFTAHPAISES
jgi:hypothetical protein